MKIKNKWIEHHISRKNIITAIFNYLENKGIKVNRRAPLIEATTIGGIRTGGYWVKVIK